MVGGGKGGAGHRRYRHCSISTPIPNLQIIIVYTCLVAYMDTCPLHLTFPTHIMTQRMWLNDDRYTIFNNSLSTPTILPYSAKRFILDEIRCELKYWIFATTVPICPRLPFFVSRLSTRKCNTSLFIMDRSALEKKSWSFLVIVVRWCVSSAWKTCNNVESEYEL